MAALHRPSLIDPPIEDLLSRVESKFELITGASRRAREVNTYFDTLSEGLGSIIPPQVASVSRKPLSIALEEVAAGKIVISRRAPGEDVDGEAAEA